MALKNQFKVALTVAGEGTFLFDSFTGGKFTQSESKYTAADRQQRSYTGLKSTENVTIERVYLSHAHSGETLTDPQILAADWRGKACSVAIYDRNETGGYEPGGRPPYIGKILDVVPPDGDTNDSASIVKLQVVVSVEESRTE